MPKLLYTSALILLLSIAGQAQNTPVPTPIAIPQYPLTKLEQMQATTGAAIIRSFSRIAEMSGSVSKGVGTVELQALELFNTSTGEKQYGLAIEVSEGNKTDRTSRSLIDLDEIDGLLAGIDAISKVDSKAVGFESYRADYSTGDYFRVSVFTNISGREPSIAIVSGLTSCTVNFSLNDLMKFREYIVMGKAKIEYAMRAK